MSDEQRIIDLRSDTVTVPSAKMREIIANAPVGDDVYGEDPSVTALEVKAAQMLGFEAGVFLTSGTQGNLVALLSHCQRGQEVILEQQAHIVYYEVGGLAALGGLMVRTITGEEGCQGYLKPDTLSAAIRGGNIHFPETGLICLENTHNLGGGAATTRDKMQSMIAIAREHKVPVHLDGARVFNAAVALGIPVAELVSGLSSVQICLSKGLGAPVGSVLVGSEAFIDTARKFRKMLGGGMRQAGIIAAAGLYALENNVERLAMDHQRARQIAAAASAVKGMHIVSPDVPTNIILCDTSGTGRDAASWVMALGERGIKCGTMSDVLMRMVTHLDITQDDADRTCRVLAEIA